MQNLLNLDEPKDFAALISDEAGICDIKINNNSLNFNYILSESGKVVDNFKIVKDKIIKN